MASIETESFTGTASYPTGGFVITTGLTSVDWIVVYVQTPGANLPPHRIEVARNTPAAGQATVRIKKYTYDKSTVMTTLASLPSGVTEATTSGQTYDTEAAHIHTLDHDHPATNSSIPLNTASGVSVDLTAPIQISTHTHSFDPPNHTGNTGAGSSHTHTWNNIYQHEHNASGSANDITHTELANGTDLSGATFLYLAVDD